MLEVLVVALGGALGSVARYLIGLWALPISREMPFGTILINIAGSFLIAFVGTLTLAGGRHPWPDAARLFVMVGVCGGFTTFSSFSLQTFELMRAGEVNRALVNVAISVVLCVAATSIGHGLAANLNGRAEAVAQTAIEEDAG